MSYLVEFGMDIIEISDAFYEAMIPIIRECPDRWYDFVDIDGYHYDVNARAIKYIHKKIEEPRWQRFA